MICHKSHHDYDIHFLSWWMLNTITFTFYGCICHAILISIKITCRLVDVIHSQKKWNIIKVNHQNNSNDKISWLQYIWYNQYASDEDCDSCDNKIYMYTTRYHKKNKHTKIKKTRNSQASHNLHAVIANICFVKIDIYGS